MRKLRGVACSALLTLLCREVQGQDFSKALPVAPDPLSSSQPALILVWCHSGWGRRAPGRGLSSHIFSTSPGPHGTIYFYEFQHPSSFFKNSRPPYVKADHGDEGPFVFVSFHWGIQGECSLKSSHRHRTLAARHLRSGCRHCLSEETEAQRGNGINIHNVNTQKRILELELKSFYSNLCSFFQLSPHCHGQQGA